MDPASPAAEARRVVESLVKGSLKECNNEKVRKFGETLFDKLEKSIIGSVRKNSCNRE